MGKKDEMEDFYTEWEVYDTAFDEVVEDMFSTEYAAREYRKHMFHSNQFDRFVIRNYKVSYDTHRRV
jgi:hypothetical protein